MVALTLFDLYFKSLNNTKNPEKADLLNSKPPFYENTV